MRPWERGRPARRAAPSPIKGLEGVGLAIWERGRLARGAALARGAPSS